MTGPTTTAMTLRHTVSGIGVGLAATSVGVGLATMLRGEGAADVITRDDSPGVDAIASSFSDTSARSWFIQMPAHIPNDAELLRACPAHQLRCGHARHPSSASRWSAASNQRSGSAEHARPARRRVIVHAWGVCVGASGLPRAPVPGLRGGAQTGQLGFTGITGLADGCALGQLFSDARPVAGELLPRRTSRCRAAGRSSRLACQFRIAPSRPAGLWGLSGTQFPTPM